MMKKLAICILGLGFCVTAAAQDILGDSVRAVRERLSQGRVTMNYYFRTEAKVPVINKGVVIVEGNCFCANGNGTEIRNDGRSQWTIDGKAREVYVEDSDGLERFFSNPEKYAGMLSDLQLTDKEISGTFHNGANGEITSFKLTDIQISPAVRDSTIFRFDEKDLDSNWLVTDLRERE